MKKILYGLALTVLSACGGGGGGTSPSSNSAVTGYTIGGTVSGLSGDSLMLKNNGGDALVITSNGPATFSTPVAANGSYAVTVSTDPIAQTCSVTNGTGVNVVTNISNANVSCAASIETVLYAFAGGADGAFTNAALLQGSDGNFYGTTAEGGTNNKGTVYQITPAGIETVLYSFSTANNNFGLSSKSSLILGNDGNFYGTTQTGGTNAIGTVFQITPLGVFTVIYSFAGGADGMFPDGGVIQASDGNFYGTTLQGGASNAGTVFKVTPAGVATILYSFGAAGDGTYPRAALTQGSDGNFYGTTTAGGANGNGAIFKVTSAGVATVLHSFGAAPDGAFPYAALIQGSDGNFYGVTLHGGTNNNGVVFRVTPGGVETVLYSFAATGDAMNPTAALIQGSDGNFYGTSSAGGSSGNGAIYKVTPAGVETLIYSFAGVSDGLNPQSPLIRGSDGHFYGTTNHGGTGLGTVYRY